MRADPRLRDLRRSAAGARILLVARPARLDLIRALQLEGYSVHTAESTEHAQSIAATVLPEAVVIALPGAPELCRLLRGDGSESAIVVLAPSSEVELRIQALEAGADDCMSSPFHVAELSARLSAARRRWAARTLDDWAVS